jgi:soluble lytic murein transglycosylase-like protein
MTEPSQPKQLPPTVASMLDTAADLYGIARGLVRGVAWVESRGNPLAKSPKGAIGVLQLMPATAASLGVDPHDPAQNIDGGVRFLAQLIKHYGGDVHKALAAYNWGPGNVSKHGTWPGVVSKYVQNVLDRAVYEGYRIAAGPLVAAAESPLSASQSSSLPPFGGYEDDEC